MSGFSLAELAWFAHGEPVGGWTGRSAEELEAELGLSEPGSEP